MVADAATGDLFSKGAKKADLDALVARIAVLESDIFAIQACVAATALITCITAALCALALLRAPPTTSASAKQPQTSTAQNVTQKASVLQSDRQQTKMLSARAPSTQTTLGQGQAERKVEHHSSVADAGEAVVYDETKRAVIDQLKDRLSARLNEDGIAWDDAVPILHQLSTEVLRTAQGTGEFQPVLAKLKAAGFKRPVMKKVGSSDNLIKARLLALENECPMAN